MNGVLYHRVMSVLVEMGQKWPVSPIEDFDPQYCTHQIGEHLLYDFHLEIRDDVDIADFVVDFCAAMSAYNKISSVKADFYEANEYPGPVKNWHTVYLTVATI